MENSTYELTVAGVTRQLPIIQIAPDLAIASFVILGDCELVTAAAPLLALERASREAHTASEHAEALAALVSDVSGGVVSGGGVSPQPTRQSSMHRQSKSSFFIVNLAYRNRVSPL